MSKYEEIEELLYSYKMLLINIENMKEQREFIEDNDGVSSIDYDNQPSNTNKINSVVENTVLSCIEKVRKLNEKIDKTQREVAMIERTLAGLTEEERTVVVSRYIEGDKWYEVSGKVRYSERHCKRIKTKAIKKMIIGLFIDR